MMRIFLFIFVLFIMGCAENQIRNAEPHERTLYEHGQDAIFEGKFVEAEKMFTDLLQQYPATRWVSSANYHLGYAYEMQKKYHQAIEKYNKVVDFYQGVQSREAAEALYRLSHCYEALGDDSRTILVLSQLKPGLKYLSKDITNTEWPARLAATYARSGNYEQAKEYYAKADVGLRRIRRGSRSESAKWLPKTFFSMGHIPEQRLGFKTQEEFENFLSGLETSQIWLLRATETKVSPWSTDAANEIIQIYTRSVEFIDQLSIEENKDKMLALKTKQEQQNALAERLDRLLQNLKTEKTTSEGKVVADMWGALKDIQKKIDLFLRQRDVRDRDIRQVPKYRGKITDGKIK